MTDLLAAIPPDLIDTPQVTTPARNESDRSPLGLCVFDAQARLVMCNDHYLQMYDMPRDTVRPGCTLLDLIDYRLANGSFTGDARV
jgi:hypothetical protein